LKNIVNNVNKKSPTIIGICCKKDKKEEKRMHANERNIGWVKTALLPSELHPFYTEKKA
jgi:hypothetical protein